MSLKQWEIQKRTAITQSADPKVQRLLAAAAAGARLQIRYVKFDGSAEARWVTVKQLFAVNGEDYCETFCHQRQDKRIFMVSRLAILGGDGAVADAAAEMDEGDDPPTRGSARSWSGAADDPVTCSVDYTAVENDDGYDQDAVEVTCNRCGHSTWSYGRGKNSIKRCLAMLREECPEGESNYYIEE